MFINNLKRKLLNGEFCLGTWVFIPSSALIEIIGYSNFDFIVIDSEHAPITHETAIEMFNAAEARKITPIFRVSSLTESNILRALDSGAHGIQVPHIKNKIDTEKCVNYSKYYPIGNRGVAPNARGGGYTYNNAADNMNNANDNSLIVINIEGKEGLDNLDEILETEHIDVVFLGSYDISQAVGHPGNIDHPEVVKAIENASKKILNKKKIVGGFARNKEQMKLLRDLGINYITFSADGSIISEAYSSIRNNFL